jgi:hypothetical protein
LDNYSEITDLGMHGITLPILLGTILIVATFGNAIATSAQPLSQITEWSTIGDSNGMDVESRFTTIDVTAVLSAGIQTNAFSILSVFAVIGAVTFGALFFSLKRNQN